MGEVDEKKRVFIEERLSLMLMKIRVLPNAKGYNLLKDVVMQIALDASKKLNMNKKLYPALAENYNISVSQIERRLKTMCEACKRGLNQSACENLFGCQNVETISAKQVICSLAERLKLECRAMIYRNQMT